MLARAGQQRGYSAGHRGAAGATARRRAVSDYDQERELRRRLAAPGGPDIAGQSGERTGDNSDRQRRGSWRAGDGAMMGARTLIRGIDQ